MTTEPVLAAAARWAPAARSVQHEDFAAFYGEYYSRVARYCFRLARDEELARDLTQEAFARLYVRWPGLRDPAAYLFHVATNLARTAYKRSQRESAALNATPERSRREYHDMHLAVSRLPRRYREVVLLYYFADLPVAAVAAAVRRPEGTVKRQLAEARAVLAADLEA